MFEGDETRGICLRVEEFQPLFAKDLSVLLFLLRFREPSTFMPISLFLFWHCLWCRYVHIATEPSTGFRRLQRAQHREARKRHVCLT